MKYSGALGIMNFARLLSQAELYQAVICLYAPELLDRPQVDDPACGLAP